MSSVDDVCMLADCSLEDPRGPPWVRQASVARGISTALSTKLFQGLPFWGVSIYFGRFHPSSNTAGYKIRSST